MDVLKQLESEHKEALQKLELFIAVCDDIRRGQFQRARLEEIIEFFDRYIPHHFRVEEEALFPVLGRLIGFDKGPIPKTIAEHAELRPGVARFLELARGFSPVDKGKVEELETVGKGVLERLCNHSRWEEVLLIATARQYLSAEELREVEERSGALH